jgi:hypothetical protein
MKISLKFDKRFYVPMAAGRKFVTTRTTKHGKIGDTFWIKNLIPFVIMGIERIRLEDAANKFYSAEGFFNASEFQTFWRSIGHRWTPDRYVYLHTFKRA